MRINLTMSLGQEFRKRFFSSQKDEQNTKEMSDLKTTDNKKGSLKLKEYFRHSSSTDSIEFKNQEKNAEKTKGKVSPRVSGIDLNESASPKTARKSILKGKVSLEGSVSECAESASPRNVRKSVIKGKTSVEGNETDLNPFDTPDDRQTENVKDDNVFDEFSSESVEPGSIKDKTVGAKGEAISEESGGNFVELNLPKDKLKDKMKTKVSFDGHENSALDEKQSKAKKKDKDKTKSESSESGKESPKESPKVKRKDKESEDFDNEKSGKSSKMLCQPCNARDRIRKAKFFCSDCGEYQCIDCSSAHKILSFAKNHNIVPTNAAKDVPATLRPKGMDLCKQHQELYKFICEDDNKLCCSRCAFISHRKCPNVTEIDQMKEPSQADVESLKQNLLEYGAKASAIVQRIKRQRGKFTTDTAAVTDRIQKMQEDVTEMFKALKKAVSKEMDSMKKQAFQEFDSRQSTSKGYVASVEQSLSEIQDIMKKGTKIQQIIVAQQLKERASELREKIEKEYLTLRDLVFEFNFKDTLPLPPSVNEPPGKLTIKYIKPKNLEYNNNAAKEVKLVLVATTELKQGEDDITEPLFTGIDFFYDGRLAAVDNKNDKFVIFGQDLQSKTYYKLRHKPQDLVIITEEEVAITTGSEFMVEFFHVTRNNDVTSLRVCKVAVQCGCICMMDEDNFMVGTIDDPTPIRVLSRELDVLELGIDFQEKRYPVRHSSCTYIKNCNKVVLTDRYANTVYIYDIVTNSGIEVKDETVIIEPRDVAVGANDCLFVCSEKTSSVVQISISGQILATHKLDMLYTCRVSVSKDLKTLAVSNACVGGKRVQLFQIADIEEV